MRVFMGLMDKATDKRNIKETMTLCGKKETTL